MPDNEMKPCPEITDEAIDAALSEHARWDSGSTSRAGHPVEYQALRLNDDGDYEVKATYADRVEFDNGLERKAMHAALQSALSAWNARVPAQSAGGGEDDAEAYTARLESALRRIIEINEVCAGAPQLPTMTANTARAVLTDTAREGEYERGWKECKEACARVVLDNSEIVGIMNGEDGRWLKPRRKDDQMALAYVDGIRALPAASSNVGTGEGA